MRRAAPGWAAIGLALTVTLAGCTPADSGPGATASSTAGPVTVVGGTRPEEQLLARVAVRHLQNHGVNAVMGEPSTVPWDAAGDQQVAIVDSLAMASEVAPAALAGPVPTPSPSPTASAAPTAGASPATGAPSPGTASPTRTASPTDPAPASPTGHPTATGTPTPLPDGAPAADAAGTTAIVVDHLPEGTEVIGESAGTLRLQAVTTTATAGLYSMEELGDLNGLCDRMVFTPEAAGALETRRLEVLAGCEPDEWIAPGEDGPAVDLVTGRADVAMLYGTDPAIADHALVPLGDPERILPEGRVLLVADPQDVPGTATAALVELAGQLSGEHLAELQRLSAGPDALPSEEAAQYWLVSAGLEQAPERWF
ncbi:MULTISPECIES: hypothetical protein [Citricoccus]|uniref:hypothetical protein n=1 Tax=Citricoccus TaxID=169133 RepID=UPI000255F3F9|nr:hypothetical protein [Citricoccus sp. CH26A]